MRLLAKLVAGIVLVVVLLLGAIAVVVSTMDTTSLLAPIEAQLERATKRDVSLGTKASIDLSLTPTLKLDDVTLGNAAWGSEREMIRAKRLEAQVALLPLLSRRIDIVRFTLVEPQILLETDTSGRGNWQFGDASPAQAPARPVTDAASAIGLGEFAIENGHVRWRDGRSGEVTHIRIARLYLRARDADKPVVAEFVGTVGDIPLSLEGHLGPLASLRAGAWPLPLSVKGDVAGRKAGVTAKLRQAPDTLELSDVALTIGNATINGQLAYVTRPPRTLVRFDLATDRLSVVDLATAGAAVAASAGASPAAVEKRPAAKPAKRIFSSEPIGFSGLDALDAQGELKIGTLILRHGQPMQSVRVKLALDNGRLDVPEFAAKALGGQASGRLVIDARNEKNAAVTLKLNGRDLDLKALMAAVGVTRDVKGGKTELDVDVNARGVSMRDFASTLNGSVVAKVGPARWISTTAGLSGAMNDLASALNPGRAQGAPTDLACVGLRLPFANGIARFDRGIGLETQQLGVAASGTIDLRSESLDLLLHPRIKDRKGLDLARMAGLVRVHGSLDAPVVAFNPTGSILLAGDIATLARGGRAAIADALTPMPSTGPNECAVALGAARAQSARAQPSTAPARHPVEDLGRALGRAFGR
ncbi:MAG TPA: AsmA family protein [Casimicrobiaceae bacterium]|nr:AsmA family protein [Casimicrobiaceae bacterium]